MSDLELAVRAVLAFEAGLSLLMSGWFFGTIWPERTWPIRTIVAGLLGVLAYSLSGQIKAYNLQIPVDWVTALGVLAYAVLLVGLGWFMHHERNRRGR